MDELKVPFYTYGNIYDQTDFQAIMDMFSTYDNNKKYKIRDEFEFECKKKFGSKHAISVSSGTAGLHLALKALDVKLGDEVITTPITWVATANSILLCGAKPVFADIENDTLNISPSSIIKNLTKKTKVILPVHHLGHPCNMEAINKIAKSNNIKVLADCALSIGAKYNNEIVGGSEADAHVFSFHSQKNISTLGEGGLITTNDKDIAEYVDIYRNHGVIYPDRHNYHDDDILKKYPWFRQCVGAGYNYRLGEFQCAVGISQLKKLDKFNKIRRELAQYYSDLLSDINGINIPVEKEYGYSSWAYYIIQINENDYGISRNELMLELNKRGIGCHVHYTPIHYFEYYNKLGYNKGICSNAERAYEEILSLPLSPQLQNDDIKYVADAIKNIQP